MNWTPFLAVVAYALAMGWVESAVVFYMRTMINRLVPYQPNPLPFAAGFGFAEVIREAATMIMLLTVGWLAGRTWRSRLGFTLLAFGVWDIAYYIWLMPLTGWPRSLADWDILFLIPLPWWGPVWAPVSIAVLMIVFGVTVARHDSTEYPLWPNRTTTLVGLLGGLLALYVFMTDALRVVADGGGVLEMRDLLPTWFNWPLFLLAWLLLAAPVIQVLWAARRPVQPKWRGLDCAKWLAHFTHNRENRTEPDWSASVSIAPEVLAPLRRSLEQFQLGDGGGPAGLIAFDADRFRNQSQEMRAIVDAWFREEAEHSRLLGGMVDRLGGRRITGHWSFTAFCLCRRALGVRFELQVLTLTELVSTAHYRVLRRHSPDAPLTAVCELILRDEVGHLAFQRDRIAADHQTPRAFGGALWRSQFWMLGHAAAMVLWASHRYCLTALGGSRAEYFCEVRRELRRFIVSLARPVGAAKKFPSPLRVNYSPASLA